MNKKLMYLHTADSSGVLRKIEAQVKALNLYFDRTIICHFTSLRQFIKDVRNVDVLYIRYFPKLIFLLPIIVILKKSIILEIATPINSAFYESSGNILRKYIRNVFIRFSIYFAFNAAKLIIEYAPEPASILAGNSHKVLYIANGIDIDSYKVNWDQYFLVKKSIIETNFRRNELNIIVVAGLAFWHGIDRVLHGLKIYYDSVNINYQVIFHVVGTGSEYYKLKDLTVKLNLEKYVFFHGEKNAEQLEPIYQTSNFGIGAIGMYRKNLDHGSPLKAREYTLFGLPFCYGHFDSDFDTYKLSLRVPNSVDYIDIQKLVDFYLDIISENGNYFSDLHKYALTNLSWSAKIKTVIDAYNKIDGLQ